MTDSTSAADIAKQVQDRVAAETASNAGRPGDASAEASGSAAGSSNGGPPTIDSKLIRDCLFKNEMGDAILFSTLLRDRFVYNKNLGEWFEWAGHFWQRDIMNRSLAAVESVSEQYIAEYGRMGAEITSRVKGGEDPTSKEIGKLEDRQAQLLSRVSQLRGDKRRTACLKFAHTIHNPLAVTGDEFDQKPLLLPCANGVLDLETGRLKPGRPGDYLSRSSPIEFLGIDAPAPLWEKTLFEIQDGNEEMVAYLRRLFGYGMTGLVDQKIFPILYGRTGWNGRSLIVGAISHVMGQLAGTIQAEMLLSSRFIRGSSGPSPDIMSLKGLRMGFASETGEGHRFDSAKIKWLTGKDKLKGRNPHDKYETEFDATHKTFLMTNSKPPAPPHDKSFWERVHLIHFPISFVLRDPRESYERRAIVDLDRQVLREASGILAWLVRGCLEYQRDGLRPPKSVLEETEKYRRDEDLLADFIDSCCEKVPGAREKAAALYSRFAEWYKENINDDPKKTPSQSWFGKQLGHQFDKTKSEGCNVYHGLILKSAGIV